MAEEKVNLEQVSFKITLHAGNAKDLAHDALTAAKEEDYEQAAELLEEAESEYNLGHEIQSDTMRKDDPDNRVVTNMLLAHSMDHLMAAKSEMRLIEEMIDLYKKID
jgi:PTS system cellobiose-specific IIA component